MTRNAGPDGDETVKLPKEVGVLLMTAGAITGMLPPPPGPFDLSLMLSGGLVLWPHGLRGVERWTREHWPCAHRTSTRFLNRYCDDLNRRYPAPPRNGD